MKNPTINVKRFLKAIKVREDVTAQRGPGIVKPKKGHLHDTSAHSLKATKRV